MSDHYDDAKEPLENLTDLDGFQTDPLQDQLDFPTGELPQPRQRLTPAQRAQNQRAKRAQEKRGRRDKQTPPTPSGEKKKRSRPSILNYLAILFAVAFLLLLMAYFQQQRQNAETADALQKSASAVQSVQNVMAENEQLRARVAELEKAEEDRAEAVAQAQTWAQRVQEEADRVSAMQWFWQIESAYVQKRYSAARELIQQFEALPQLKQALPAENTTGTQRFSPADRYQEIYNALY